MPNVWRVTSPKHAKTQAALRTHVRCPLLLPNFNQNCNVFSKFRNNTFHESCLAILDQLHAMHGDTNRSIIKTFCTALSRFLFQFKFRSKYGELTRMRMKEILRTPPGYFTVIELPTLLWGGGRGVLVTGKTFGCIAVR